MWKQRGMKFQRIFQHMCIHILLICVTFVVVNVLCKLFMFLFATNEEPINILLKKINAQYINLYNPKVSDFSFSLLYTRTA